MAYNMTKKHSDQMNGVEQDKEQNLPEDEITQDELTGQENETAGDDSLEESSSRNVEEVKAALEEMKDKHLRLLAEFDNYKKRTMRERIELLNTASKDVMTSLLTVLDDFDRAKKSADDPDSPEVFSEGIILVYNRLYQALESHGLKGMESNGETFDPELHDAITEIPAPSEELKGKVIDTVEKGYFLHDKIIRHAKVVVGN